MLWHGVVDSDGDRRHRISLKLFFSSLKGELENFNAYTYLQLLQTCLNFLRLKVKESLFCEEKVEIKER